MSGKTAEVTVFEGAYTWITRLTEAHESGWPLHRSGRTGDGILIHLSTGSLGRALPSRVPPDS
jgi:hypothetical protein